MSVQPPQATSAAGLVRLRTLTLPCNAVVVPQMRGILGDLLVAWGLPPDHELLYDLKLIASELIANAVEHASDAAPDLTITLALADGELLFGVRDGSPFCPSALVESADRTSGRGLHIVTQLATESGGHAHIAPDPDGKTVWITLPWPAS